MAESSSHLKLVDLIEQTVFSMDNIEKAFVIVDKPTNRGTYPPTICGFRPDVYYCFGNRLIIGEAKTEHDILVEHTERQIEAYLDACNFFNGISLFVIAVPWKMHASANNLIIKIMKKLGYIVEYKVVDELI